MHLVRLVLALLFGGRFIAATGDRDHRCARLRDKDSGDASLNREIYGEDDDEGW